MKGLLSGAMVKNSLASAEDVREMDSVPESIRKIPWRRKWQPAALFLPGKFHGGAWQATVHGITESDMTKQLSTM